MDRVEGGHGAGTSRQVRRVSRWVRGRPLPGTAEVRLVEVDAGSGAILAGPDGFAVPSEVGAPGVLLSRPRLGVEASARQLRGVFRPGDLSPTE